MDEILKYLRNMTRKLILISDKQNKLEQEIIKLQKTNNNLGKACGEAFRQIKEVCNELSNNTADACDDLSEYLGNNSDNWRN